MSKRLMSLGLHLETVLLRRHRVELVIGRGEAGAGLTQGAEGAEEGS